MTGNHRIWSFYGHSENIKDQFVPEERCKLCRIDGLGENERSICNDFYYSFFFGGGGEESTVS